jgi:hypothetical protein
MITLNIMTLSILILNILNFSIKIHSITTLRTVSLTIVTLILTTLILTTLILTTNTHNNNIQHKQHNIRKGIACTLHSMSHISRNAECQRAQCHYAKCHFSECHVAVQNPPFICRYFQQPIILLFNVGLGLRYREGSRPPGGPQLRTGVGEDTVDKVKNNLRQELEE